MHNFVDGFLPIVDSALQVTVFDTVLHSDISGIVFAIDERCANVFLDAGQFFQRNLLAVGRSNQQIADLIGSAAELRLHAHD